MYTVKNRRLNSMVFTALMTALICVIAPFAIPIPFSPVPLSLSTFILYLSLYIIGPKYTFLSCLLYLALGGIGVPVFSGFRGGVGVLLGPTGGYLIGYLFIPLIGGLFLNRKQRHFLLAPLGLFLGTACCYICGSLWLTIQTDLSLPSSFFTGVFPFLPGDLCKIICVLLLGPILHKRLRKANIMP